MPLSDLPRGDEHAERSHKVVGSGTSSVAQSRRAKNAANRADDVEFAFEIGSGLLTEVRRLQSLLAERDKTIQEMKDEKDDLEKKVENLRIALQAQEQSAEDNWNLEVALQELQAQLQDTQASAQRLEGERARIFATTRDTNKELKNEVEQLRVALDVLKAKYEKDIAQARKTAAGFQRDRSDLQTVIDMLRADTARPVYSTSSSAGPGAGEFLTPGDRGHDEGDSFSVGGAPTNRRKADTIPPEPFSSDYADSSPDVSPSKPCLPPSHPSSEIKALQQRLADAQRMLRREKELRLDHRRKLESSPGFKGSFEGEEDDLFNVEEDECGFVVIQSCADIRSDVCST